MPRNIPRRSPNSSQPRAVASARSEASTPARGGTPIKPRRTRPVARSTVSQPSLFSTEARKRSREAATATKVNAQADRQKVLAFIRGRGELGATDQEMQVELEMSGNTQRPRRGELVESGHVAEAGMKRKTISGCWATVWIATDKRRHEA